MLSEDSKQFLVETRMYLIHHGKSDRDIEMALEELENQLIEGEQNGKSTRDIVGDDPKAYMKSVKSGLPTAKQDFIVLIPATVLVIVAYLCYIPALDGNFRVSSGTFFWGALLVIASLAAYSTVLFKWFPKFRSVPRKFAAISLSVTLIVTTGWLIFMYVLKLESKEAAFVATPAQNLWIVMGCLIIFVLYSLYTKSWITIILPLLMTAGPVAGWLIPEEINKDPFYITVTIVVISMLSVLIVFFYWQIGRKNNQTDG